MSSYEHFGFAWMAMRSSVCAMPPACYLGHLDNCAFCQTGRKATSIYIVSCFDQSALQALIAYANPQITQMTD